MTMATTASNPGSTTSTLPDTPAMRQYARFKREHPGCVLFFRMGDFYEMFADDAELASRVLGITLTQRTEGLLMAGVPYHAVEGYLRTMIERGYRVAVCEQVQDPKEARGIVDRAVTRVLTPGTLIDENLLDDGSANTVAAVLFTESGDRSAAVIASAELSTGAFVICEASAEEIPDEFARLAPREVLYAETADGVAPPRIEALRSVHHCALTPRPAWTFRIRDAADLLRRHFGVRTLDGFGFADDDLAVAPAGAMLRYLLETQASAHDLDEEDAPPPVNGAARALPHLRPPVRRTRDAHLVIDAASLRALEIERTMRSGGAEGSLLSSFTSCRTSMGKRLLRQWLCYPLRDRGAIEQRQDAVAALVQDREWSADLSEHLGRVQDVARIAGRVALGRATPRDLVALGRSLNQLPKLCELLEQADALTTLLTSAMHSMCDALLPLARTITERCIEAPPHHLRDGGVFRDGVDRELDETRTLQRDAATWLAEYQAQLIRETQIPSLKVGYNRVFGYYIEITNAHRGKAPDDFQRKQTLKNAERYVTSELKEFEEKVTTAEARALEREKVLFDRLCKEAAQHTEMIGDFAQRVAALDVLACFADTAVRSRYVRPALVDEPVLAITAGRHPVLDRTLGDGFVPNDCVLGAPSESEPRQAKSLALITGPNMAGKSTFIRQTALITLLAHTGSFVPAESAVIGVTDRLFTRIGASDELHAGQSTFMVEMTETARILHHATPRSLVVLDEIGRGTSTLDGLSLAWAIAESLARVGCRTLFATHYHELTELPEREPALCNLHVAVREWRDEVVFLYRILPGRADRSYGIHVAKIAGLPPETIQRAKSLLETLAVHTEQTTKERAAGSPSSPKPSPQLSLFTEYLEHPALEKLRAIDLDALTPLAAFDLLREIAGDIDGCRK